MRELEPWCRHPKLSYPRRRIVSGGRVTYWRQCISCGQAVGNQWSYSDTLRVTKGIPPKDFDEELRRQHRERQASVIDEMRAEKEKERARWWAWYETYLKSDQWRELRYQVLERCEHLCEGCRMDTATEVHHLTYDHVGNEFLFELVGLCQSCHARVHRDRGNVRPLTFPLEIDMEDYYDPETCDLVESDKIALCDDLDRLRAMPHSSEIDAMIAELEDRLFAGIDFEEPTYPDA